MPAEVTDMPRRADEPANFELSPLPDPVGGDDPFSSDDEVMAVCDDEDSDGPLSDEDEEDYALHRRVAAWQAKVEPMLQEQSCRSSYDIGAYKERLLESFDDDKRPVARQKRSKSEDGTTTSLPFEEVACTPAPHEISRFFLAALQLTADQQVDLSTSGSVETGDLCLTVNLLSRTSKTLELESRAAGLQRAGA